MAISGGQGHVPASLEFSSQKPCASAHASGVEMVVPSCPVSHEIVILIPDTCAEVLRLWESHFALGEGSVLSHILDSLLPLVGGGDRKIKKV